MTEQIDPAAMSRSRTPQDKKVLSYARDGRNTFAESTVASRKSIAKRKAKAHRALRRAERIAIAATGPLDEADPFVARTGRKSWRKIPDAPLAEYVRRKLGRRKTRGMNQTAKSSPLLKKGQAIAAKRRLVYKGPLQDDSG